MVETNNSQAKSPGQIPRCISDPDLAKQALRRLSKRTNPGDQKDAIKIVHEIIEAIKREGDKALIRYTKQFDKFNPNPISIPQEKLEKAWHQTSKELKEALDIAYQRIHDFHKEQIPKDIFIEGHYGEILRRRWRAVDNAGIYIPGGRASYPSTVLMNAVPAQVAGVKNIIMVSPANSNGEINKTVLAAAHVAGIKNILRVGGAQAIAALAYGTETIKKVDVISGPGNLYVTLAKKEVYGEVGIDSLAGPSEVLIIADHTAKPDQVAADLLAQAEHDPLASAVLLTNDSSLAEAVPTEIQNQLKRHPRAETCLSSIINWGLIVICKDLESCVELSDEYAPEHLELLVENPSSLLDSIHNAGAIFVGPWTPEAVGDYLAGPNHTLPTSGTARFSSPLSVETFMKNTSIIEFNKNAFRNTSNAIMELAKSESLYSHSESIRIRS